MERVGGVDAPANPPEEAEQMSVANEFALVVPHGLDELVEPDGCICGRLSSVSGSRDGVLQRILVLQWSVPCMRHAPTASFFPCSASMLMRLPTGSSSCQRLLTPMAPGLGAQS